MGIFTPEFWSDQVAVARQAWAIFIPLLLVSFWLGVKFRGTNDEGELRALRAHKDFVDAQLRQVRDQTVGEAKSIAGIQAELGELRKLVDSKAPLSTIEPILQRLVSDTGELAAANSTTHHILTAKSLSVGSPEITAPILTEQRMNASSTSG